MLTLLITIFVLVYAAIALEHPLKINKSATALLGAGLLWTVYAITSGDAATVGANLNDSLTGTAQIVFFLIGAMTIVEVVDAHNGFEVITSRIKTQRLSTLMWMVGFVSFFLSSMLNLLVPLGVTAVLLGDRPVVAPQRNPDEEPFHTSAFERNLMFFMGLGMLVAVPLFKTLTGLPPFLGILFGLGVVWLVGDVVHRQEEDLRKQRLTLARALTRIDMSSVVFFIGILLSVALLEHTHILSGIAQWLDRTVGRQDVIVMIIGLVSAVVDNVPLVAASMGMYDLKQFPADSFLWEFMAYCAGTGGSILIIGSASGVAAMGLEKIDFLWYMRKISGLALIGYLAGAVFYIAEYRLLH